MEKSGFENPMNERLEAVLERPSLPPRYVNEYLDETMARLQDPTEVSGAFAELRSWLFDMRQTLINADTLRVWLEFVDLVRSHGIADLLLEDPLTARSYEQPRGYPGDARELDYIYDQDPSPGCSPLGRILFTEMMQVPECHAVRTRRKILAQIIDETAARTSSPEIFSVASGHIREAELSEAMRRNRIGRLVALDQDNDTIREVKDRFASMNLTAVRTSIYKFAKCDCKAIGRFDLVYVTGLFDYLRQEFARQLTSKLFALLKPNGRLLVANFLPGNPTAGYMETYMRWDLIYRSEDEMNSLSGGISSTEVKDCSVWCDHDSGLISYLDITRA
jgi:SAM-dependent methyltransferase